MAGPAKARFEKLRAILAERNPFYREKLRGAAAFEEIPFTTKAELVQDQAEHPPFGSNLTFPPDHYVRMHHTSGTSGKSLLWLDTPESWDWWLRCWAEVYRGANLRAGDRVYVAFSFGPFIGFWAAFESAQRERLMTLSGGGQTTSQRLHAMLEWNVTALVCTPTYALRLAEEAKGQGIDLPSSSIRATIHAGEPGASIPATRLRIEEAFGARAYDHVGMTEVGAYGFECPARNGMHINEDEFIVELVDPETLGPVDDGEKGELVLTNLGRVGMPLVRYRTGDLVALSREPCPCGRPFARMIGGVLGRADDMITIRGVNVFPSAIENIVRRHPAVTEFAIEISSHREMHELRLKIEAAAGGDPARAARELQEDLHRSLHVRTQIEVVPAGELPRYELKSRRVRILD